jgi:hypothetical protein
LELSEQQTVAERTANFSKKFEQQRDAYLALEREMMALKGELRESQAGRLGRSVATTQEDQSGSPGVVRKDTDPGLLIPAPLVGPNPAAIRSILAAYQDYRSCCRSGCLNRPLAQINLATSCPEIACSRECYQIEVKKVGEDQLREKYAESRRGFENYEQQAAGPNRAVHKGSEGSIPIIRTQERARGSADTIQRTKEKFEESKRGFLEFEKHVSGLDPFTRNSVESSAQKVKGQEQPRAPSESGSLEYTRICRRPGHSILKRSVCLVLVQIPEMLARNAFRQRLRAAGCMLGKDVGSSFQEVVRRLHHHPE